MGRGAEKQAKNKDKGVRMPTEGSTTKLSLAHMSDQELQRWASLYGVKDGMTRDQLLVEMVRLCAVFFQAPTDHSLRDIYCYCNGCCAVLNRNLMQPIFWIRMLRCRFHWSLRPSL